MPYICKKNVRFSGEEYAVGAEISIDDTEERDRLVKIGAIVLDGGNAQSKDTGDEDPPASVEDIIDIFKTMQNGDDILSEKPKISDVRTNALDFSVHNDAFQKAWAEYQNVEHSQQTS